jgi:hypothetical protein
MMKSVQFKRLSILGCALAIGLLAMGVSSTAYATLLWYDGFDTSTDYVADTAVGGQTGGSGSFFTGPWVQPSGDDHIVRSFSLTRPGQINPSIGGSLGDYRTDSCCITSRDSLDFSSPWHGLTQPNGTYYFGFLANFGHGPALHHRVLEMWNGDAGDDGNRNLQFGFSEFTGVGPRDMSIKVKDATDGMEYSDTLSEHVGFYNDRGTTHFVVLKFDMSTSGNDVISVYLDPVGTTEPGTPSAQISVGNFLVDRMGGITNFVFGKGTAAAMDELRVADNSNGLGFSEVANNTAPYVAQPQAMPEPTSILLIGLGVLGLMGLRRQK